MEKTRQMEQVQDTGYDYNVIKNLNLNIRVSRDVVLKDEIGNELTRTPDIKYSQAVLTMSDMEDMLECANSVAENVNLHHKENSLTPDLTSEQLNQTRKPITNAISTLIDNLTNPEFVSKYVETLDGHGDMKVNRFKYKETSATHETTVYLMYLSDILSATLIIPRRPGAIINNYSVVEF